MHLGEEILEVISSSSNLDERVDFIFQGLDFLHENRIAHCDILEQNIGINVISAEQSDYRTGVCGPDSHYALFDFGFSSIFPLDVDLDSVPPRDNLIFEDRYLPDPGPCNPFRADVIFTGNLLERYVRVSLTDHALEPVTDSLNVIVRRKYSSWRWAVIGNDDQRTTTYRKTSFV